MSAAVASFQGPNRIVVVPVLEDVERFRVVNVERPHHPSLVLDLTSNYERQARPRRIERFYSVLHFGRLRPARRRHAAVARYLSDDAMTHGIITSTGNLVAWFESEQDALAGFAELARDEPEAADEIAAIPFDDDGKACGPAVKGAALLAKAA